MTTLDHKAAKKWANMDLALVPIDDVWTALAELQAGYLDLREKARDMLDFMKRAPVSSGVCCCGEEMTRHNSPSTDHSPVDMWDNAIIQYEKALRAILGETGND